MSFQRPSTRLKGPAYAEASAGEALPGRSWSLRLRRDCFSGQRQRAKRQALGNGRQGIGLSLFGWMF